MATLRPPVSAPASRSLASALLRPQSRPRQLRLNATRPLIPARYKSGPYGYTQAKSLVFSQFGDPSDVLNIHKFSISPTLPSNAVLLRTLASPINPADINTIQGTYGALPSFSPLLGTSQPSAIPGGEGVFEVVSVGSGVSSSASSFKRGDWVIPSRVGYGTWRTHVLVEDAETDLVKIDKDRLTPAQVATVSVNPCSAWRMLRDFVDLVDVSVKGYGAGATGGAWFIQNGANSGVGRAAIQLGRLWGLRSVNVVRARETPEDTEALRRELTELGADVVLTEEEAADSKQLKDLLAEKVTRGGREPLLLGLNCVGGKSATRLAKSLSMGGTLVTYGAMSKQPVALPTGLLIFKDLSFRGFWLSRWAKRDPEGKKDTVKQILDLTREGKFKDVPLEEVRWDWDTKEETLREAVAGTLGGFRKGKEIFVFEDT